LARFGDFEVDIRSRELRKNGLRIKLQDQPFQILQALLERPGEIVTRDDLQKRIWPADTFVDFDHGLNNAVKRLREALRDTAETPRYIETLPKRGYRFVESLAADTPEASIAVLPFLSLSADPENEIFADGISEEIINALMQIRQLHVAARTSSFSFKGKYLDLRVIGEQLNVRTVLEGSVRKAGDRFRITAQLVNVADGYHLWAERYDRETKDIFEIQEDIARSIARRLEVTLEGEQQSFVRAGTDNLEAFKLFSQGRALSFQRGPRFPRALEYFKQAVALDPKYGVAWSALADVYNMIGFYGFAPPQACLPQAKEAALRAVSLSGSLAEAHNSLAMSYLLCDWDQSRAEREFLRALELNPRYAQGQYWYALFYLHFVAGRFEEGLAQVKHVVDSDPLSGWARGMLACMYINAGKLDDGVTFARAALKFEPDSFLARWALFTALNAQGHFEDAAAIGREALAASGRHPWMMGWLTLTYAQLRKPKDSSAIYMELLWRSRREYVPPGVLAWAASGAGKPDVAIKFAQEAHAIGDPVLIVAKYWPTFGPLREDPRFNEILFSRGWR
jgi:TolB-like protein